MCDRGPPYAILIGYYGFEPHVAMVGKSQRQIDIFASHKPLPEPAYGTHGIQSGQVSAEMSRYFAPQQIRGNQTGVAIFGKIGNDGPLLVDRLITSADGDQVG